MKILKQLRESNRLTQVELSKILNITQTYISQLEKGERKLSDSLMMQYSKFFRIPYNYLVLLSIEFQFKELESDDEIDRIISVQYSIIRKYLHKRFNN